MPDATNVSYGKPKIGGAVYRAPIDTKLPTDAKTELDKEFVSLGYISADGLTNGNTVETDKVKAWGGDVVMYVYKGKEDTFKLKLIECLNPEVLKAVYGDGNVSGDIDTGIAVKVNSKEPEAGAWVVDMVLKGGIAKRIVIPTASVTAMEDIVYKDDDAIGYGLTLSAEPDKEGNTHTEYMVKPGEAAASA